MLKVVAGIVIAAALGLVTNIVSGYIPGVFKRKTLFVSLFVGLVTLLMAIHWIPDLTISSDNQPGNNTQMGNGNSGNVIIQKGENITIGKSPKAVTSESERLRVTDILVGRSRTGKNRALDFRLLNNSKETVTISRLRLSMLSYKAEMSISMSPLSSSAGYAVELDALTETDGFVEIPVSHVIQPGAADRFEITLGSKTITSNKHLWKLKPTLFTSEGEVSSPDVSISIGS